MLRHSLWFAVPAAMAMTSSAAAAPDQFGRCSLPPGYYRVAPPASAAALRVRSSPQIESALIGNLQRSNIVFSDGSREVRDDVVWQHVKSLQVDGWAEARSLWRALPLTVDQTALPVAGRCSAFDPLWSLLWQGHQFRLSLFPGRVEVASAHVQDGARQGTALASGEAAGVSLTFVYAEELCTDSQGKPVGWGRGDVILRDATGERLFSGCCETAPEAFVKR